jgi:hypothetical protein
MSETVRSLHQALRLASHRLLAALMWSAALLASRCMSGRGAGARQPIDNPGGVPEPVYGCRQSSIRRTSCPQAVVRDVASLGGAGRGVAVGRWGSENVVIGLNCSGDDTHLLVSGLRPDFSSSAAIGCMRMARWSGSLEPPAVQGVVGPSKGATIWRLENAR